MSVGLEVRGLAVARGGRRVLEAIDLDLPGPGWFGLLGANGSGKTSLLQALAGRLPPAGGSIRLDGRAPGPDPAAWAAQVGFASPIERLPALLRGGDVLDLLAAAHAADPRAPAAIYDALGVAELLDLRIGAMSSGLRQRLAVFAAFLGRPRLVLLDEPFNWLDPLAAYELKAALTQAAERQAIVTALHDVATFLDRCTFGVLLHAGRIVQRYDAEALAALGGDVRGFERGLHARLRGG